MTTTTTTSACARVQVAATNGARRSNAGSSGTRQRRQRVRGHVPGNPRGSQTAQFFRRSENERRGDAAVRRGLPNAFEPAWWAEQVATCGVILAAYAAYNSRGEDGLDDEACPKCEGTGRAACSCTRWSSDGEGCGSCGYTGVTACPACRGGGRAVRVTVKIEVPTEREETPGYERDRSGLRSSARRIQQASGSGVTSAQSFVRKASTSPAISLDSSNSSGGSPGNEDEDGPSSSKDDDFYAQSGEAIRVLREDYPYLLSKEPRWSIYRDDIGLYDETMTFAGPGRERNGVMATNMSQYKRVFKLIRIVAAVLFSQSTIEVSRIWSPLGSTGLRTIRVRWSVRGKVRLVGSMGVDEARFDGISEYKLDSKGFIYEHKITDLDWDVAQLRERAVSMMRVAQGQPYPPIGSGEW